tara:strand:- start:22967 stop:23710 length:744 start_codon:yes stop_codon:yes gene_type:complete
MVNIDRVYQRVLVLANKEQRGYITPQEFNLLANHAQMDIFEQYFYDLNQFRRMNGNDTVYSDMSSVLEEKISLFRVYDNVVDVISDFGDVNINENFDDFYRLELVRVDYQAESGRKVAELIQVKDQIYINNSPLLKWTTKRPVYINYSVGNVPQRLKIYPYPSQDQNVDRVLISYIKRPALANWGFTVVGDTALYNQNNSQHFELHPSEETELVIKILTLAGVVIKDPNLYNIGTGEDNKNIQQEKQ